MKTSIILFRKPILPVFKRSFIIELIVGLYILLFVYTGIAKLTNHEGFESVLSRSPLIEGKAHYVAWGVPVTEILIVLLLLFPHKRIRRIGLYAATILMLAFTGYIIYMINFTPNLPCSCGGVIGLLSWKGHLIFNSAFTALGIFGIYIMRKESLAAKYNSNSQQI